MLTRVLCRPWFETALLLFCTLGFIKYGSTKGTNCLNGGSMTLPRLMMAPARVISPVSVDSANFSNPSDLAPVTNLCLRGIERGGSSVSLGLAWPSACQFTNSMLDLYGTWRLASNVWTHLAQVNVRNAESNAVVEVMFSLFPTNAMEESAFFTVADQSDADGDGASDALERLVLGSNPTRPDSDGDGISDGDEYELGSNPVVVDSDGDGLLDAEEVGAAEVMYPAGCPSFGSGRLVWPASFQGAAASHVIDLPHPYKVNGVTYVQARVCTSGVVYLLNPEHPERWCETQIFYPFDLSGETLSADHIAIAAFGDGLYAKGIDWGSRGSYGSVTLASGLSSVIDFHNMGFRDESNASDYHLFSFRLTLPSNEENVFYLTYMQTSPASFFVAREPTIGVQCPQMDPLRWWEDFYYVDWKPTEESFSSMCQVKFTIGRGTDPACPDSDGDGFADGLEECVFLSDPNEYDVDTDGDGLPDSVELWIGTDPENGDTDCDLIGDLEEFLGGLDPLQSDSDGDGLNDGWEKMYDGMVVVSSSTSVIQGVSVPFCPSANNNEDSNPFNDATADPDGDGLTNAEECSMGLNPCNDDTDGDGVKDSFEIVHGSDPGDPSDDGLSGSRIPVSFRFGDHSSSHSEKYRLSISPVQAMGVLPRSFNWLNEDFGECETRIAYLKPGWKYEVKLSHAGTNPDYSGSPNPDYDYTLVQVGALPANVIIADPDSLFGISDVGLSFSGAGKVAYMYVLDKPRLVPDYDRNGEIGKSDEDRAASENAEFSFWLNDDNDTGGVNDSGNDRPGSGTNGQNDKVDGLCDLLDFTPVLLDVSRVFPPDTPDSVRNRISWKIESDVVNLVWTSLSVDEAGDFHRNDHGATFGLNLSQNVYEAKVESLSGGKCLSEEFESVLADNGGKGVVMIEGHAVGSLLKLKGYLVSSTTPVVEGTLDVRISSVEDMYRLSSLRGAAECPHLTVQVPNKPSNQPEDAKNLDIFFLHGFNVNAENARAWGAEVFKRLWQAGSNVRFHVLPWNGNYSWAPGDAFNGLHYQHNVWFAQRTGGALKRYIEAAQSDPARRILITHSLGNVVACEALREGLNVSQYYMFNAAVPSEAIDGALRVETSCDELFERYVRPEWRDYTNACWASNWYRLFASAPSDPRGHMGWVDRFRFSLANASEVFNYYSSGDSVFTEQSSIPSLWSDVYVNWGLNWILWLFPYPTVELTFENHCWQKQEVLKGMSTIAGTVSGGWGFNVWQEYDSLSQELKSVFYSPAGAAAAVANLSVMNRPVFDVSNAMELMDPNATEDDVFLAIAKHVPALSSPIGGRAVLDNGNDYNLNDSNYRNGWGRNHPNFGTAWLHSDMRDMAYFYVYKLYEQLVQKGGLK